MMCWLLALQLGLGVLHEYALQLEEEEIHEAHADMPAPVEKQVVEHLWV